MNSLLLTIIVAVVIIFSSASILFASPLPSSWYRGTDFFALNSKSSTIASVLQQIDTLDHTYPKSTNLIALQWMYRLANKSSNVIESPEDMTPKDDDLCAIIRKITVEKNKIVLLKPVITVHHYAGGGMNVVNPSNPQEFFDNYETILLHIAKIASSCSPQNQQQIVFCVGLELKELVINADYVKYWAHIIAKTRSVLPSGTKIIYGSDPLGGETSEAKIWDFVDEIGVDLYIPFVIPGKNNNTDNHNPSRNEMLITYEKILWFKLLSWYNSSNFANGKKKIFITESGYPSTNEGLHSPWVMASRETGGCTGVNSPNLTAQAVAFDVQFEVLNKYPTWFSAFTQFWHSSYSCKDYPPMSNQSLWSCGWTILMKNETLEIFNKWY